LCAVARSANLAAGDRTGEENGDVSIELSPGEQVGDYRVEGVLGRGGAAIVYRAVDISEEAVAMKFILPELAVEKSFRSRFELEISIAQRVSHPNVVRVLDSGEHNGLLWLTETLVTGGSLVELLERDGPLPVAEALKILDEVAAGLDAVHAVGLVHRDVKPANILMRDDGRACITDFGLARDTASDTRLTRPGQMLGSMSYMAPEQVGAGDVGPFTDVYSLGCVLFECLAGSSPFADRPGMAALLAHLEATPPDPCQRNPALPREVGAAVRVALAKAPAERPASASEYARLVRAAASLPA
jgi:serine/threonine protein kinase